MKQCNNCDNRKCLFTRTLDRFRKEGMTRANMMLLRQDCDKARPPDRFLNPLLRMALVAHPQGVADVLQDNGMQLREHHQKPYFKLITYKKWRRVQR